MFVEAIEQLRSEDYFGTITLFHNGNQATTYTDLEVTNDTTNVIVTPLAAELTEAYTRWQAAQAIRDDEAEAHELTRRDVKILLVTELVKLSPDTAAVHTALKGIIDNNERLTNAHQNIATLYSYDTATPLGYLQAALLLIALMS